MLRPIATSTSHNVSAARNALRHAAVSHYLCRDILHDVQVKIGELSVAEALEEVPSSLVSAGSNRTDTETLDLFWSDANTSE